MLQSQYQHGKSFLNQVMNISDRLPRTTEDVSNSSQKHANATEGPTQHSGYEEESILV